MHIVEFYVYQITQKVVSASVINKYMYITIRTKEEKVKHTK